MQFFVMIIRVVIDTVMSRLLIRGLLAVLGLVGLTGMSASLITCFVFLLIIFHPKTRVVYGLVREFIVHVICKAVNVVVKVPENLHGARYARA